MNRVFVFFFLIGLSLYFSFFPNFDADFGWHLKTGEYVWQNQHVPQTDIFSFSLPDHSYTAHSWLTDVALYGAFSVAGHNGVVILYGFLLGIAVYLASSWKQFRLFYLIIPVSLPFILIGVGLRTQVVSFSLFSILLWLLLSIDDQQKVKKLSTQTWIDWLKQTRLWIIPLLFWVWANAHAGFVMGLGLFGMYCLFVWFQTKNKNLSYYLVGVGIISLLATVINPYGFNLHFHIFDMITNQTAAMNNLDWLSYLENPIFSGNHNFLLALWIGLGLYSASKKSFIQWLLVLFGILLLYSTRFLLPLSVVLLFSTPNILDHINSWKKQLLFPIALIILIFSMNQKLAIIQGTLKVHQSDKNYAKASTNQGNYPYESVEQLLIFSRELRIFNYYDWGGYLIWHLPPHKTFIDGRMDNFFVQDKSFMEDYLTILEAKPGWEQLLAKYNPNTILLPPSAPLLQKLNQSDWNLHYKDQKQVLLIKKN